MPLNQAVHKVAEHFTSAIDGRTKVYGTTTYDKVRQILQSVQQSGYFEKRFNPEIIEEQQEQPAIEVVEESDEVTSENQIEDAEFIIEEQDSNEADVVVLEIVEQQPIEQVQTQQQQIPLQNVSPPQQLQQPPQQLQQQPIVAAVPANQIHTTVRAVEQTFYKQHQYIQQMRPITEVIGTGSFFFLQESELDTPDQFPAGGNGFQPPPQQQHPQLQQQQQQPPLQQQYQPNQSQIPTQTYTNQSFKSVVPPQPIYPGIKNNELNNSVQQHNIPGFASNNSPVPVITAQLPPLQQQQQQVIVPSPQLIAPIPIPGFISPQQQQQYSQQQLSQSKPQIKEITNSPPQQQQHPKENNREKHDPQINPSLEWNPNDAAIVPSSGQTTIKKQHQNNDSLEWSDPSGNDDVKEWKMSDGPADNGSNTWSNDNQNDNYGNRNNNYRGNNRNGGGNRLGGSGGGGSSSGGGGGYRGRSNNSYNQSSNQGRGSSNGGSGTFYRNNDNNYYQNQNGGNGGYNNRSEGGYRNGGDSYKPRGGTGGGQNRNNDRNSPGHDQQRDQQRPRTNNTANNNNRRGGGGSAGGSMPGDRPQGNAGYRSGPRPAPTATNQPKQTVNAN